MIEIETLDDIETYRDRIESLCFEYGIMWSHSYSYFQSKMKISNHNYKIYIDEDKEILCSIEKHDENIWKTDISGYPFICNLNKTKPEDIRVFLQSILEKIRVKDIYISQVYANIPLYCDVIFDQNFLSWKRLSNPLIRKESFVNIYAQLKERTTINNVDRVRKKYKRDFRILNKAVTEQIQDLEIIEKKSWKKVQGQDMLTRENQFVYYSELLQNKVIQFQAAYYEDIPVSYVLYAYYGDILYLIKWSYDQTYRKYSPGKNLILDIIESYDTIDYKYIDLYGSPDTLKELLETERIVRFDFAYPGNSFVYDIKKERMLHDYNLYECYKKHYSLRSIY